MHGPDTLDDMIFQILSEKSQVISDALDGKISEYHIKKAHLDDCIEEVKELNTKGTLNPVVIAKPKPNTKQKIEDFFKKQKDLNNFVKKKTAGSKSKCREEDIDDSSSQDGQEEDEYLPLPTLTVK